MPIANVPLNDRSIRFTPAPGTTVFATDFPIYTAADLVVTRERAGVITTLAMPADYAVTGLENQAGATVTLTAATLAGDIIALRGNPRPQRTAGFVEGGGLPASALNDELNRLVIAVQDLLGELGRTLRVQPTDATVPLFPSQASRAGKYLGFNASGDPIATEGTSSVVPITPFAATLLDDTDAAAALTTLGVSAFIRTLLDDADGPAALATLGVTTFMRGVLVAADAAAARTALNLNAIATGEDNLLINPNPTINQRGYVSGAAVGAANTYTLDRWRVVTNGQALSWTDSAGVRTLTAPAGGVEQVVEGAAIVADTYTLTWTGTATATVNGATVANGGQVVLPGGANATVRFSNGTVASPKLARGDYATPFVLRPPQVEQALCDRYTQRIRVAHQWTAVAIGEGAGSSAPFRVRMRAAPTITSVATVLNTNINALNFLNRSEEGAFVQMVSGAAGACAGVFDLLATAEL